MKKVIFAVIAFMLSLSAFAADPMTYKSSDGKIFSIEGVRKIQHDAGNGKIVLTFVNALDSGQFLGDVNGAVFNKIKLDHPEFLTHGSDTMYVQKEARWVLCLANKSNFSWRDAQAQDVADNCALAYQAAGAGKVNNP